jgi:hypothetical protein
VTTSSERRERDAAESGRAWAGDLSAQLRREGRRASGGWPGTLTEARSRVVGSIGKGEPLPGRVELHRLTRILYQAARSSWLRQRDADPSEP